MNLFDEQKKAFDFINTTINKNKKISHAYLIETNNYSKSIEFVKQMIINILTLDIVDEHLVNKIKLEVEEEIYPDVKYIEPDGVFIKKEQLLALEKEFSKKSMLDNKLIYVIKQANKLNDSSANTILKFLEEPSDGIVAILLTENRYEVLETIISRCQTITLINNESFQDISDVLLDFIKNMSSEIKLMTYFDSYFDKLFSDKLVAQNSLLKIETILLDYINNRNTAEEIYSVVSKFELDKLIKFVIIIEKERANLDYNVNMKLWFNNLIIELVEVI